MNERLVGGMLAAFIIALVLLAILLNDTMRETVFGWLW